MKLNELDSRISSMRNDLDIMEKAICNIKDGNKTCTCDYSWKCTDKDCNVTTIKMMKISIARCINTMHEVYFMEDENEKCHEI